MLTSLFLHVCNVLIIARSGLVALCMCYCLEAREGFLTFVSRCQNHILEEKYMTATRHGIDKFLKYYSETSMDFSGQLLVPIDTRRECLCCFAVA